MQMHLDSILFNFKSFDLGEPRRVIVNTLPASPLRDNFHSPRGRTCILRQLQQIAFLLRKRDAL